MKRTLSEIKPSGVWERSNTSCEEKLCHMLVNVQCVCVCEEHVLYNVWQLWTHCFLTAITAKKVQKRLTTLKSELYIVFFTSMLQSPKRLWPVKENLNMNQVTPWCGVSVLYRWKSAAYTLTKIINATLLFLPPFFMSWTQRSKTFSMYTKGLFLSNIVHKSV